MLTFPNLRRELSRRFAVVMKESTGRGPDHIRVFVNQNLVILFAQGTLTASEEVLVKVSRESAARDVRNELQLVVRDRFVQEIGELTGLEVISPLSDHGLDPDLAVYCFALEGDLAELLDDVREAWI